MKVFGRIGFALLAALLLVAVHNFATRMTADAYFDKVGNEIFTNSKDNYKYRFFYGSTGYHLDEPTYKFEFNNYLIQFFEVNKVFVNKEKDVKVEEYFYIMITHPSEVLNSTKNKQIVLRFHSPIEIYDYHIQKFKTIPFSLVVDEKQSGLIEAQGLIKKNIQSIDIVEIVGEQNVRLASGDVSFDSNDLVIKNHVYTKYNDESYLNSQGIYLKLHPDSSDYNYIYVLIMLAYALIVIVIGYFLYFNQLVITIFKQRKKKKEELKES